MKKVLVENLLVTTTGDGHHGKAKKTFPVRLEVEVDLTTIERDTQGKIDYVYCRFRAFYSKKHWDDTVLNYPYTDKGFKDSINAFLFTNGYSAGVGWSTRGHQENGCADFDMHYDLIDEIFIDHAIAA